MTGRQGKRYVPQRTSGKAGKVTVTKLPTVKCALCRKKMAYKPEDGPSKVLTAHVRKEHPDARPGIHRG